MKFVWHNRDMYKRLRQLTADMVHPLTVNRLRGRVMKHPSRKTGKGRTIVFVYGIHGSLERFYGVIHFLARFGTVTAPDLPGFGGMDSYYKIGLKPSLDRFADYLADFIERDLPEGKITLVGLSYGFVVLTRLLERHPQLVPRVDMTISLMGMVEGSDMAMSRASRITAETVMLLARAPITSSVFGYIVSREWMLQLMYPNSHPKMKALPPGTRNDFIQFESYLWRCNDLKTWGTCLHELLNLHRPKERIPVTIHNISTKHDHWLNVPRAEAHMNEVFAKVISYSSSVSNHGGVAYEDESEAYDMIPPDMAGLLETAS